MAIYLILMAVVLILAYPLVERKPSMAKKLCYVICTFAGMLLISVFRYGLGNDYYSYIYIFRQIAEKNWLDMFNVGYEPGFVILTKLISCVTSDVDVMFTIYAVLILLPAAYAIFMHSKNIWMSTMMFISLTFFYCSLSFIRQAFAVSLILLAYRYFKERNHFMVLLFIFLGALFHSTVIVMIPLYFIAVLVKPTKITVPIYAVATVAVFLLSWPILELAVKILPQYKGYLNLNFIQNGYNPVYIIVPTIIMAVALFAHFTGYGKAYPKESSIFTNFAIFNFIIWFLSLKHFVIERFSMYPYVLMIVFIPSIISYYKQRLQVYMHNRKHPDSDELPDFDCSVYEQLHGEPDLDIADEAEEQADEEILRSDDEIDEDEERKRIIAQIMASKNKTAVEEPSNEAALAQLSDEEHSDNEESLTDSEIDDDVDEYQEDEEENASSEADKKKSDAYKPDINYLPENYVYRKPKNGFAAVITSPISVFSFFMALVTISCLWYNYFGLTVSSKGFHGVVPYKSTIPAYMELMLDSENDDEKNKLLRKEDNILTYLYRLKESDHYSVIITTKGTNYDGLNNVVRAQFERMGLTGLAAIENGESYIGIMQNGEVVYQDKANGKSVEHSTTIEGFKTAVTSSGDKSVIKMGAKDFSLNEIGFNIVVLDNNTKKIVDKVRFKAYYVMLSATRGN